MTNLGFIISKWRCWIFISEQHTIGYSKQPAYCCKHYSSTFLITLGKVCYRLAEWAQPASSFEQGMMYQCVYSLYTAASTHILIQTNKLAEKLVSNHKCLADWRAPHFINCRNFSFVIFITSALPIYHNVSSLHTSTRSIKVKFCLSPKIYFAACF